MPWRSDGDFDDCQAALKAMFADRAFAEGVRSRA
jgi:threonine synthase